MDANKKSSDWTKKVAEGSVSQDLRLDAEPKFMGELSDA